MDAFEWMKIVYEALEAQNRKLDVADITQIPPNRYLDVTSAPKEKIDALYEKGLEAIASGQVAALVLAGGQASRLGSSVPKGVFPLGLQFGPPSSLFYCHTARLGRLLKLAKQAFPDSKPSIPWIVMVSNATENKTKLHMSELLKNAEFPQESLIFIRQDEVPTIDFEGNFMYNEMKEQITNPNGNGGVYDAIRSELPRLEELGVKYIHVFSIDNILNRPADPVFVGACIEKQADCAAKVVEKTNPREAVGNLCLEKGRPRIVEYSEITPELAERRDPAAGDKLFLRAGSIANHIFSLEFLQRVCNISLSYHVARKKVAHFDGTTYKKPSEPNAYKLERFIFDSFSHSRNFLAYQVEKSVEFSPLKNSDDVGSECLSTCLRDLAALHAKWLTGTKFEAHVKKQFESKNVDKLYVDPRLSYGGEGLDTEVRKCSINAAVNSDDRLVVIINDEAQHL